MGLLLSVFAGTHISPDGEVKVWHGSAEQSLLDVATGTQRRLDFKGAQQMVRDHGGKQRRNCFKNAPKQKHERQFRSHLKQPKDGSQ